MAFSLITSCLCSPTSFFTYGLTHYKPPQLGLDEVVLEARSSETASSLELCFVLPLHPLALTPCMQHTQTRHSEEKSITHMTCE